MERSIVYRTARTQDCKASSDGLLNMCLTFQGKVRVGEDAEVTHTVDGTMASGLIMNSDHGN